MLSEARLALGPDDPGPHLGSDDGEVAAHFPGNVRRGSMDLFSAPHIRGAAHLGGHHSANLRHPPYAHVGAKREQGLRVIFYETVKS